MGEMTPTTDHALDALVSGSNWSRPNDRTPYVDATLVRVVRALDAAASAYSRVLRAKPRTVEITSVAGSVLTIELTGDGRWRFVEGSWIDGGREQSSVLLRPTLRGIARATRPHHPGAMTTLALDVDLVCAQIYVELGAPSLRADDDLRPSIDEAIPAAFGLDAKDAASLLAVGSTVEVGAGTTLMLRGEAGKEVFFLADGVVEVDLDDGPVLLRAGSVVGERAVLDHAPRSATVRAATDLLVLAVPAHSVTVLPSTVQALLSRKVRAS
jgi:Cyclic nucleotide-binding domain